MIYQGRFAPTPSGNLHFGSLVAALGSFLRAKAQSGLWHVRIDDIDVTRCKTEYTDNILRTLENYGFYWDGEILYQSKRTEIYENYLEKLIANNETYGCDCSRAMLKEMGGIYLGHCRNKNIPPIAPHVVRYKNNNHHTSFIDLNFKTVLLPNEFKHEDFVLKRRDQIFSYNLVTVIDDSETQITEVVRGADILEGTFRQLELYDSLKLSPPQYLHLPLALEKNNLKLSKQNHAPEIPQTYNQELVLNALKFLGQEIFDDYYHMTKNELQIAMIKNFKVTAIPHTNKIVTDY